MHPAGFEPTIPASERSRTHALERAATGIGSDESADKMWPFSIPLIICVERICYFHIIAT